MSSLLRNNKIDYINTHGFLLPEADFSADPTEGTVPLNVQFSNLSAAGDNEFYDYGIRAAHAFSDKFAAKANFSYLRGTDWYAVNEERGLCMDGWHVPSDAEYTVLTDYLGGESVAGGKMKEAGLDHWNSPNTGATNESGFTGLPAGYRRSGGRDENMEIDAEFWASSEDNYSSNSAEYLEIDVHGADSYQGSRLKYYGISIRCLKD